MTSTEQPLQTPFGTAPVLPADLISSEELERQRELEAARFQSRLMIGLFAGYILFAVGLTYLRGGSFLTPDRIAILIRKPAPAPGAGRP